MYKLRNHKRLIHLHCLGIPVPEPFGDIYSSVIEYLKIDKIVNIFDIVSRKNECSLDKDGEFVYSIFKDRILSPSKLYLNTNNSNFLKINRFVTGDYHEYLMDSDLSEIIEFVLRRNNIEFDELLFSTLSDKSKDSHFGYLNKIYSNVMKMIKPASIL